MTTIVTRAYKDLETAKAVVEALRAEGHPARDMNLFAKGEADLEAKLAAAKVPASAAAAYAKAVEGGKPVVVARAEITPFGAAATAKRVLNSFNPVAVAGADGDFYVSTVPMSGPAASIRTDHGLIWTRPEEIAGKRGYRFSSNFGWKLLSDRKPAEGAIYKGRKHFTEGWFGGLLSTRKPAEGTIKKDHPHMSKSFWPSALLSDRKPAEGTIMKDHPHMSQRFWPAPLLSQR
jgi:hypothetical protein